MGLEAKLCPHFGHSSVQRHVPNKTSPEAPIAKPTAAAGRDGARSDHAVMTTMNAIDRIDPIPAVIALARNDTRPRRIFYWTEEPHRLHTVRAG